MVGGGFEDGEPLGGMGGWGDGGVCGGGRAPVSMLDVSIRADILNLLRQLRDEHGITILYITHDLATAAHFTDRLAVMYLGRIVEIGPTATVLRDPQHPYTQALGETPNPIDLLPSGCRFHSRCPVVFEQCRHMEPKLASVSPGHQVACLRTRTGGG